MTEVHYFCGEETARRDQENDNNDNTGAIMIYEIVITGDTNDADYVTRTNDITQEQLDHFMPLIEAIKTYTVANGYGENWPISQYSDGSPEGLYPQFADDGSELDNEDDCNIDSLIDEFREFVPWSIHSITSVVYYEKPVKTVLL